VVLLTSPRFLLLEEVATLPVQVKWAVAFDDEVEIGIIILFLQG
jgi:hypothetical protein